MFGFLIAILDQQRSRFAEAAEVRPTSSRGRTPETGDCCLSMAHDVDQSTGAEPRLGQGREQLSGTIVGSDCSADVPQLFKGDSQAEICISVARVASDRALQCGDRIRYAADLQAGEAEVVLN
ncbi:MAG TPA: hypothetical protein VNY51_04700 [Candidatus Dormibacteraeota bacterium]|nr:hypothetical protein [Candidatus Dormibacteraeota bacterium]